MSPNQLLIFNQQPLKTYSDLKPFHFTRNKVSSLFNFSATIFSTSLLASRVFFSSAFSNSFFSNSLMISLAPERFAAFSQEFSELQKIFFLCDQEKGGSHFLHPTHLTRYWRFKPRPLLAIIFLNSSSSLSQRDQLIFASF